MALNETHFKSNFSHQIAFCQLTHSGNAATVTLYTVTFFLNCCCMIKLLCLNSNSSSLLIKTYKHVCMYTKARHKQFYCLVHNSAKTKYRLKYLMFASSAFQVVLKFRERPQSHCEESLQSVHLYMDNVCSACFTG